MTLHLVYEKAGTPSMRIRLVQMAPHLESRGLACRISAYPRGAAARRAFRAALAPEDVVLVHRARPTAREARWWRELPVVRIYDFDDAVMWGRKPGWRGVVTRWRRSAGFRRALASVHGASCGNAFLATQCGALPAAVVPSAVRLDVPRHHVREVAVPFRIGWVGRRTNLRYVRAIAPALQELARRTEVELVVVSDGPLELPGCRVANLRWSSEDEAAAVAGFDAGIMPLSLDDPWSLGKCAYKLIQYMAAGVPAVGSDVGMNRDLIEPDRNGLLARSGADWLECLGRLASDPALRARLGSAGRETAQGYGYAAVAERLTAFVTALAQDASSASR